MEANERTIQIRELTGMKRAEFARKYNIPYRTLQDWEAGKAAAPEYVLDLLERAVRQDEGLPYIYRVYSISTGRVDEEWEILKTASRSEAIERARREQEINQRDKTQMKTEIRLYEADIDDEDCDNWDYDPVEF